MMPSITRFLVEGAELLHQDCSSMDRVMRYLEDNLDTLYHHLNNENFSRTLDIVWEQLGEVLYELIQANLEVNRLLCGVLNLKNYNRFNSQLNIIFLLIFSVFFFHYLLTTLTLLKVFFSDTVDSASRWPYPLDQP